MKKWHIKGYAGFNIIKPSHRKLETNLTIRFADKAPRFVAQGKHLVQLNNEGKPMVASPNKIKEV